MGGVSETTSSRLLTLLSLLLTTFANFILAANVVVWTFTMVGALMLAVTLVSLGVGLGALSPNFNAENPLQVGLSLGGFGYMAASLAYVGAVMVLMARPVMSYFLSVAGVEHGAISAVIPVVIELTLSVSLSVISLLAAERRLTRFKSD